MAACWYTSSTSFTVDVDFGDDQAHKVSLYLLDWDTYSRAERIDVVDPASGAVLGSVTASSFHDGEYLSWTVSGHVEFVFTNLAGSANAVLSGIFIDGVATSGATGASYAYDATGRRIEESYSGGSTNYLYYDSNWNVIEERQGGTSSSDVHYQYVMGASGDLVLRDTYASGSIVTGDRLYALWDANGDITAVTNSGGTVEERYEYSPYGVVTVLTASGTPVSGNISAYGWQYLFQGGRQDTATGLYIFEHRDYDPASGTWMQRDPIGLAGGDLNEYRFVGNDPIDSSDPAGLSDVMTRFWGGVQAVGGLLEASAGVTLLGTPSPDPLTKFGGAYLVFNGADNYLAGVNTLLYGKPVRTVTNQAIEGTLRMAGHSPEFSTTMANTIELNAGIAGGIRASTVRGPARMNASRPRSKPTTKPDPCPPVNAPNKGAEAVAKVRAAGITDCEAAANELGKPGYLPGGKPVDLPVFKGNHTAYYKDGMWYDSTGLSHVLKNGYWTEANLAKAGLLDAAKSGVFAPQQYEQFIKSFSDMPMVR